MVGQNSAPYLSYQLYMIYLMRLHSRMATAHHPSMQDNSHVRYIRTISCATYIWQVFIPWWQQMVGCGALQKRLRLLQAAIEMSLVGGSQWLI